MLTLPIADTYAQTFNATLDGQACIISLYQKSTGMFLDLTLAGTTICTGAICQNLNRIVRANYLGFIGDLCFIDTQGSQDPTSPGLGSRYALVYLEAADVASIVAREPT